MSQDHELNERMQRCIEKNHTYGNGGLNRKHIMAILYIIGDEDEEEEEKDLSTHNRDELVSMLKDRVYMRNERFQIIGRDSCPHCRTAKQLTGVTEYIHEPPAGAYVPSSYKYVPQIFEYGKFIGGLDELKKCIGSTRCPQYTN